MYIQKIVSAPTYLYCKFCRSVGHDKKDCRAYQLLQEKTVDTYMMNICKSSELMHNTLNQGGVVLLRVEDEDEDLVVEGAKLFVIIVDN